MAMVTNWNDWEKLIHHSYYNELRVTPECHPIIIIDPPLNPKNNREKTVSVLFEKFNVPNLMVAPEQTCTIIATGRSTGVILESGDSVSHATCVLDFIPLKWTILRSSFGGRSVTESLVNCLCVSGYEMTTSAEREIVRDIKEKLCYIALDTEMESLKNNVQEEYELPDGTKMVVGSERYIAPEMLFNPSKFGSESSSFQDLVHNSVSKCTIDLRKTMRLNTILSGGNTLFEGFDLRLQFELEGYWREGLGEKVIKIIAPNNRQNLSWTGASIIGSLNHTNINNLWISKEQYDDAGATIVHRTIM